MTDKPNDFYLKLQHLIGRVGLTPPVFVDQFAKHARLRKSVAVEYLGGLRTPYGANRDKVVEFFRPHAATLTSLDFDATFDEFKVRVENAMAAPKREGVLLPLPVRPLDEKDIEGLVGAYRVFRPTSKGTTRVMSEALSISKLPPSGATNQTNALLARLWSVAEGHTRVYEGVAILAGDQVNIMLTHGSETGDTMRILSLKIDRSLGASPSRPKDGTVGDQALVGVMTGASDGAGVGVSHVAAIRYFTDPRRAEENETWRSTNADEDAGREVLLRLLPRA